MLGECSCIISNPGENCDCEMNIMWHTSVNRLKTILLYTKKSDKYFKDAKIVRPKLSLVNAFNGVDTIDRFGNVFTQNEEYLKAVCYLKDLEPNTEYMYKVGEKDLSEIHYFKTGGNSDFSVALIADFHSYLKCPNRLKNGMAMVDTLIERNGGVDFCFDIGDVCAWGGSYNFWQTLYQNHNFYEYMWASVNGNHDNMDKSNSKNTNKFFGQTHGMPLNGYKGEEGVCYYFKYSGALFIVIDNEYLNKDNLEFVQSWVQSVIDNNRYRYLIFVEHYQWFNLLRGGCFQYDRWKSFFDKNDVDLAISANHHIYARSTNVFNDEVCENGKGTVYLELSSSDGERGQGTFVSGDVSELETTTEFQRKILKFYYTEGAKTISGVTMNINDDGITLKLYDRNGNELDRGFVKRKNRQF